MRSTKPIPKTLADEFPDIQVFISDSEKLQQKEIISSLEIDYKDYRRYLSHVYTFTIDTKEHKIKEDAISISKGINGMTTILFHTFDMASHIEPDSSIDNAARKNMETIFLKDTSITMFPNKLVKHHLSFNNNSLKNAITIEMVINEDFKVVETNLFKSIVKVKKNFKTSNLFNKTNFLGRSFDEYNAIRFLENFYNNVSDKSFKNIISIKNEIDQTTSHVYEKDIVSLLSIMANYYVTKEMTSRNLPYIYRNCHIEHGIPIASYSTINEGHELLGFDAFGHFSTGTRNFVALTNQRMVHDTYFNKLSIEELELYKTYLKYIVKEYNKKMIKHKEFIKIYNKNYGW